MEYDVFVECAHADKTDRQKSMILLTIAGAQAIERERAFEYLPEQRDAQGVVTAAAETRYDPAVLKGNFRALCSPCRNVIVERHMFNSRCQEQGESISTYVSDLRIKASTCEFGALHVLVRDRIITGITSKRVRKHLLKESDLITNLPG